MAKLSNTAKSVKNAVEKEAKFKKRVEKKVEASQKKKKGRPLTYSEAERAERKKASQRKWRARQAAKIRVEKTQAAYMQAKKNYLASIAYTIRDTYYMNKADWDEFCRDWGSVIAYLINKYDYDNTALTDMLEQEKGQRGEQCIREMLSLDGVSHELQSYMEAEKDYTAALENQAAILLQTLESFLK